jgi:hypothetical protein
MDDLPHMEDLGGGMYVMDIAPLDGCLFCGHWKWGFCLVNAGERVDLLTNRLLKNYSAKSDCMNCGMLTVWSVDPDKPYLPSSDEPFAK